MTSDGRYVLNGDWSIAWPGPYEVAGTRLHYARAPDGTESLEAPGPTDEDLHVMVLLQEPNPGIEYEFWLPRGHPQPGRGDASPLRQPQPRGAGSPPPQEPPVSPAPAPPQGVPRPPHPGVPGQGVPSRVPVLSPWSNAAAQQRVPVPEMDAGQVLPFEVGDLPLISLPAEASGSLPVPEPPRP
uniref:ADAMTS like 5 n=1 Tax=Otus sunia TaxID=257818 RepID=A0A8C8E545_9STRI